MCIAHYIEMLTCDVYIHVRACVYLSAVEVCVCVYFM